MPATGPTGVGALPSRTAELGWTQPADTLGSCGFSDSHALLDGKTSRYSLGYNRSATWIHMESSICYLARHERLSASYMSAPCRVLLLTGKASQRSQTRRCVKLAFTKRRVFTVWPLKIPT